jgi:hypothetical protein
MAAGRNLNRIPAESPTDVREAVVKDWMSLLELARALVWVAMDCKDMEHDHLAGFKLDVERCAFVKVLPAGLWRRIIWPSLGPGISNCPIGMPRRLNTRMRALLVHRGIDVPISIDAERVRKLDR